MRSRAARLTATAIACLALAATALLLFTTERSIANRRTIVREFDLHVRAAVSAIGHALAGQQAYVAAGQTASAWIPKVGVMLEETASAIDTLRGLATSDAARNALLDSSASLTVLRAIEGRARDYLTADQPLMASDVLFTEGADRAALVVFLVETARRAEVEAFETYEGRERQLQAASLAGAVGMTALILVPLAAARAPRAGSDAKETAAVPAASDANDVTSLSLRDQPSSAPAPSAADAASDTTARALDAAAALCTDFSRVRSLADLRILMAKAADTMNASGLVVWLGTSSGGDLERVVAHGYSDQVLEVMRAVPRDADNAAAAAYRSGTLQVVAAKPGTSLGAVVAPLISPDGCIGALTAEIRGNGEVSETVHALAAIFAAQLAGVLAAPPAETTASPQTMAG